MVIIDAHGRVSWGNGAAMALLEQGDGLCLIASEHLHIATREARASFRQALRQCVEGGPGTTGAPDTPGAVIVPRSTGLPLLLSLQCLPEGLSQNRGVLVLLQIHDPDAQTPDQFHILRRACGLSPTEARLVQALSEGYSLKEFAASRQISYETVRSHIRRILQKMGVRRQADLVRIAHKLH